MRLFIGFLFMFFFASVMQSQSIKGLSSGESQTLFLLLEANSNLLETTGFSDPLQENGNNIFIQQQGYSNVSDIDITSEASTLTILQNGSGNNVKIDVTVQTLNTTVKQYGRNNNFSEVVNDPTINLKRNIQQNGNNHNLVIYGSNSLMDDLKLNMTGSAKTITIRNFK